jgi:hypothetical protein
LLTIFLFRKRASVIFDGKKLYSKHKRSLVTLVTFHRYLTEHQVVISISIIVLLFTIFAAFLEIV